MLFGRDHVHVVWGQNDTHVMINVGWFKKVPLADLRPAEGDECKRCACVYEGECIDVSQLARASFTKFPGFVNPNATQRRPSSAAGL